MSTSRGRVNQWLLMFYKSYPSLTVESVQKDLNRIISVYTTLNNNKSSTTCDNNGTPTQTKDDKKESETLSTSKDELSLTNSKLEINANTTIKLESNQESVGRYSEVKKALRRYIPELPDVRLPLKERLAVKESKKEEVLPKWMLKKRDTVSKTSTDARARHLVQGLSASLPDSVNNRRIEDFCSHLKLYPHSKGAANKASGVSRLLKILYHTHDDSLKDGVREALALIGYVEPVRGQGIRILSIDGGGVRGLVTLKVLRAIEERSGKPIHELFDLICGVSTGAVLAVLLGSHRLNLPDCESLYLDISNRVFSQTTFRGTTNLVWKNSFYDSDAWNNILKENMGEIPMIDSSRKADTTKLCLVSTQANSNWIKPFLFRNYNFPSRVASHFNGSSYNRMWEGVRASAAAPAYFSEFRIDDLVLLDGGVLVNNPTSIAIHEARQLWPDSPLQSVISIGTGKHEPIGFVNEQSVNWTMRLKTFLNSATDTEGVHTTLHDLLPGDVYYRLNPFLSEDITLDEIRKEKLDTMVADTELYLRKNEAKVEGAVASLTKSKTALNKILQTMQLQRKIYDI